MKVWAKVTFKSETNPEHLAEKRTHSAENAESSIVINSHDVNLQIVLSNLPVLGIDSIETQVDDGRSKITETDEKVDDVETNVSEFPGEIDSESGKTGETQNADEIIFEDGGHEDPWNAHVNDEEYHKQIENVCRIIDSINNEERNETEEPAAVEDTDGCSKNDESVSASEVSNVNNKPESHKGVAKRIGKNKGIGSIPQLDEFANKSSDFGEFMHLIATSEWLGFNEKDQREFETILNAVGEVDKIVWPNILEIVRENGENRTCDTIRQYFTRKITQKLYPIKITDIFKAVAAYKGFEFDKSRNNQVTDVQSDSVALVSDSGNVSDEVSEIVPEANSSDECDVNALMECMPNISEFNEMLSKLDKNLPIKKRIEYVFSFMGIDSYDFQYRSSKNVIISVTFNLISSQCKSMSDEAFENRVSKLDRMLISSLINSYISSVVGEDYQPVSVLEFFKDLQRVILSDEELKIIYLE